MDGFRYERELIERAEEEALVARVRELPFREFEFHGYKGKRRVVSFGWKYEFPKADSFTKRTRFLSFFSALERVRQSSQHYNQMLFSMHS